MIKRVGSVAALGLALVVAACGSSGNDDKAKPSSSDGGDVALTQGSDLQFAMVTHSDEGSFWSVVKKGAEQAAKDEGVKLIWSPSNNDPQKEAQLIDAAVSQKVDGLAVSVPNADAIKDSLAKAKDQGIPIITLNSGAEQFKELGAITHVGQDESIAGQAAGDRFKSEGVKLIWSPSNNDPQKEAQLIDAAVSQKVDGLAVSVPNADAIKGALKQATDAGIPIITLNSGETDSKALGAITHVGQDESVAGKAAGERLKADGAKKVLCIIHEQNNIGLQQRCDGVKQGFGGDVTNLQVKGTADIATTQTEIKSKLQADKSYDAVIALNPDIAAATAGAIKGASSDAKLATFDLNPEVIKRIKAGDIEFAVDQQQYLQGYLPIVFLKLFKTNANTVGGGQPVLTGPGFVDKSNVATVEKLANAGTR